MNKEKRFWGVMIYLFTFPLLFALLDVYGAIMWESVGGWGGEAYTTAQHLYQGLFWTFAYVMILSVAFVYYSVTKDKSESLAMVIVPATLLQFGVEDVFFYWIRNLNPFEYTMPWLQWNLYPTTILGYIFNGGVINGYVLFGSALLGILISYFIARWLLKR